MVEEFFGIANQQFLNRLEKGKSIYANIKVADLSEFQIAVCWTFLYPNVYTTDEGHRFLNFINQKQRDPILNDKSSQ